MSAWTLVYAISAGVCVLAGVCANLMSRRPRGRVQHLHQLARLAIVGAGAYALARVLTADGYLAVWPEQAVMLAAVAALTLLAGHGEAKRQRSKSS